MRATTSNRHLPETTEGTGNTPIPWMGRPAGRIANPSTPLDTIRIDPVRRLPPSTYSTHSSRLFQTIANPRSRRTTGRCGRRTIQFRHTVPCASSHSRRVSRPIGHGRRDSRSSGHGRGVSRSRGHGRRVSRPINHDRRAPRSSSLSGRSTSTATNSVATIRPPLLAVVSNDGT